MNSQCPDTNTCESPTLATATPPSYYEEDQ